MKGIKVLFYPFERYERTLATLIKNSEESRGKKDGQAVHQHKAELEVFKDRIEGMKEDLTEDKNEQEIEAYDNLEENLMDINLKIVAEIANDEYYLVEKTTRRLTHKLEKMKISKYRGEFAQFHNWSSQFLTYTDGLDDITKRAYLIDALEGKAQEFIGDLVESEAEYDEFWKRIKGYFGNKRYVQDDTINAFFIWKAHQMMLIVYLTTL